MSFSASYPCAIKYFFHLQPKYNIVNEYLKKKSQTIDLIYHAASTWERDPNKWRGGGKTVLSTSVEQKGERRKNLNSFLTFLSFQK